MKTTYSLRPLSAWQLRLLFPPLFHLFADSMGALFAPKLTGGWLEAEGPWSSYIFGFMLGTVGMYFITESNFWSYYYLERRLPWERNSAGRLVAQLSFATLFSIAAAFIIRWVLTLTHPGHGDVFTESFTILVAAVTFLLSVVFLGMFVFHRLRASLLDAERLQRENLIAQNQALRQQIDPHFLFNSITTLTTLIEEDKTAAIDFVRRLSHVYRHVLQSKQHDLVSLGTEIDIVRDYAFAFEKRFGTNFRLVIDIPEEMLSGQIPPLTLQILVENAVKHNIITDENPLSIRIERDGESHIVVRNAIHRKTNTSSPTHIGLQNILDRYRYVAQGIVEVTERNGDFTVRLPVIRE